MFIPLPTRATGAIYTKSELHISVRFKTSPLEGTTPYNRSDLIPSEISLETGTAGASKIIVTGKKKTSEYS
ncbi:hypothetical protein M434DRAFT_175899 [Hypoxylon sp. CO27-5]|nr:hypothetical protein M434DRAFT_175899 [Hypoxylon sp. CO27-5]